MREWPFERDTLERLRWARLRRWRAATSGADRRNACCSARRRAGATEDLVARRFLASVGAATLRPPAAPQTLQSRLVVQRPSCLKVARLAWPRSFVRFARCSAVVQPVFVEPAPRFPGVTWRVIWEANGQQGERCEAHQWSQATDTCCWRRAHMRHPSVHLSRCVRTGATAAAPSAHRCGSPQTKAAVRRALAHQPRSLSHSFPNP